MSVPSFPPSPPAARRPARAGGIALVVLGSIAMLVAIGLLAGGGVLMWADRTQRDAFGYLTSPTTQLTAPSYAIAVTDLNVAVSSPTWRVARDALGKVRVTATPAQGATQLFLGIAPRSDALRYLSGVAYDELTNHVGAASGPTYVAHEGGAPAAPTSQSFWQARATGGGTQTLSWQITNGQWAIVVMNADASRGVSADVSVAASAPFLFALALGLLIGGAVAVLVAGLLLFGGIRILRPGAPVPGEGWVTPPPAAPSLPPPPPTGFDGLSYPLHLGGRMSATPARWLWLVKWFLLIPHYVVLVFLYVGAFVLTVIAFFAILVTGRYPRSIFDFNVAVLRWSWRVSFYGYSALGTDRYPPFTFSEASDYPATLAVPYPERLSRGLVLVKWWLLAIPHYLIVAVLVGGSAVVVHNAAYAFEVPYTGLITILVLIAGVALLFTARYPRGIFDLVMGLNRWVYRVFVYVLLLRDEYPPFRLDMGGEEPAGFSGAPVPSPAGPAVQTRPSGT